MTTAGRVLTALSLGLFFLSVTSWTSLAQVQTADEAFARARELRAQGEFAQAVELLSEVIKQHSQSDQVLRKAYNDLVFTYLSQRNASADSTTQSDLQAKMIKSADEALRRFPGLQASTQEYPPEVGLIYDTRRALLFGRVEVTSTADSSRVFLRAKDSQEAYQGITPLTLQYVPVGDYSLTVARSGYKDHEVPLTVGPSAIVQREVTLSKERTRKWWLTRVVVPATATAAIVTAIVINNQGSGSTDTTQPLADPPPPPSQ